MHMQADLPQEGFNSRGHSLLFFSFFPTKLRASWFLLAGAVGLSLAARDPTAERSGSCLTGKHPEDNGADVLATSLDV